MRQRKSWEMSEEEVLALEEKYTEKLNWFERLVDNNYVYPFVLLFVDVLAFDVGLLIGVLL